MWLLIPHFSVSLKRSQSVSYCARSPKLWGRRLGKMRQEETVTKLNLSLWQFWHRLVRRRWSGEVQITDSMIYWLIEVTSTSDEQWGAQAIVEYCTKPWGRIRYVGRLSKWIHAAFFANMSFLQRCVNELYVAMVIDWYPVVNTN